MIIVTKKEFFDLLPDCYVRVKSLSYKENRSVELFRNTKLLKEIIIRTYPEPVFAYEELKNTIHPNLPEIYDTYTLDDAYIVIEEYVNGISIADVLIGGKYTYSGAKKVLTEVCNALDILHSINIIHRDIKPENIVIAVDGTVKLVDLDAARQYLQEKKNDTVAIGTIGYAPPEQFGITQTTPAADIYALGVLLNVMLTGQHPSLNIAKGKAGRIVSKCTMIDPEKRYPNVHKFVQAL